MDPSLPQHAAILPQARHPIAIDPVSATSALWPQDRIARLTALTPEDAAAGLLWLAMNDPATCDAMLDKLDDDAIDDPDPGREPAPYCAECDTDIGIFHRDGRHWQHYTGDVTITGSIKTFDPGHEPVVAWRLTSVPA